MRILASFLKKKGTPAASAIEISADVFLNQVAVSIVILELIKNRCNNITLANGTTIPELQHSTRLALLGPDPVGFSDPVTRLEPSRADPVAI